MKYSSILTAAALSFLPLAATAAAIRQAADCDDDSESLSLNRFCSSAADCPPGAICESITKFPWTSGVDGDRKMCTYFTAAPGEACDLTRDGFKGVGEGGDSEGAFPNPALPQPGCKQAGVSECVKTASGDESVGACSIEVGVGEACDGQRVEIGRPPALRPCADEGPNGVTMECLDSVCVEFGFEGKCGNGVACPKEGAKCFEESGTCLRERKIGEVCKQLKFGPFNGFRCGEGFCKRPEGTGEEVSGVCTPLSN